MSDENKKPESKPEITSLSDEETITEIDLGNFLADENSKEVIYDGFHDDIAKTEKSLEDELQSLYDDIMSTGPVTIVPKKIEEIVAEEEKPASELDSLWMSPADYMEIPEAPIKSESNVVEPENSPAVDNAKDDIFGMIESLKSDTESEKGFDSILSDIESNQNIAPVNTDLKETEELTKDYVPAPELPDPPAVTPAPKQKPKAIDTDSAEFKDELAALLGDEEEEEIEDIPVEEIPEEEAPAEEGKFKVTIPDDDVVDLPEDVPYDSLIAQHRTVGVVPTEIIEDDGKISRKEKKQAKLEAKIAAGKKVDGKGADIVRRIVLAVSIITIIVSSGILVKTYVYEPYVYKKNESQLSDSLDVEATGTIEEATDSSEESKYPTGMLAKYKQLYDINSDIRGWISIPALEINLPVAQGEDNDYYLHRNIYKKSTSYGVPFFDYRIKDFTNLHKNTVIYGHNMRHDDLIFGLLENYREIDGFKSAPTIECNTIYGDFTWKVYAVFITNSKASQDNGYLFPYNFIDISDEQFASYIEEVDKRKFYTTGVDINETDKILTLSTCCYDFDGARLVVVARLLRDGESTSVDTTLAVKNDNPRYPQAWYDANKKTNPYSGASNWNPYGS